ncbi:S-adenosyl-L-methionine-dependent methyltransferase [Sodiomyces alkalinus F11]|uniref:S-adenosyl-L-methionine-dependent methyltransferase n=1 Tax=Sodiomyces alkalinus (strain CBS 110278 / VKM F-3762 / F11) TaxID=1314773 RepID=A0A3N2PS60_SODAK|nr:S-adenosyl-L-methionine-dependent methyltransferase [Sodiomyces alkalinus F11]ROT37166.1 S-adenosyl-L-methionine-dependent methyltransferase [Sodiomyces alkalinus F11]
MRVQEEANRSETGKVVGDWRGEEWNAGGTVDIYHRDSRFPNSQSHTSRKSGPCNLIIIEFPFVHFGLLNSAYARRFILVAIRLSKMPSFFRRTSRDASRNAGDIEARRTRLRLVVHPAAPVPPGPPEINALAQTLPPAPPAAPSVDGSRRPAYLVDGEPHNRPSVSWAFCNFWTRLQLLGQTGLLNSVSLLGRAQDHYLILLVLILPIARTGTAQEWLERQTQCGISNIISSIEKYRDRVPGWSRSYYTIDDRIFHSEMHDRYHHAKYWAPVDWRHKQALKKIHLAFLALLDDQLCRSPIQQAPPALVLDVGTGHADWAFEFAKRHPSARVIGTDLSPLHPELPNEAVPENFMFRTDNYLKPWLFCDNVFDMIHMRFLFGTVQNWNALFREAYRCAQPGAWVESCELDFYFCSDDMTIKFWNQMKRTWPKLFDTAEAKTRCTFRPVALNVQREGMMKAGFTDIHQYDRKILIGRWVSSGQLCKAGTHLREAFLKDIEGFTKYVWSIQHSRRNGDTERKYRDFVEGMESEIRSSSIHAYFNVRYVYGRKPQGEH